MVKVIVTGVWHIDAKSINGRGAPFPAISGHEGAGIVSSTSFFYRSILSSGSLSKTLAACTSIGN
ncbi:alcohol dehydrogenase catalytic domain-containing protein [Pontibacter sp. BT327]|uniref:Alcohol dehydrogenase catalytic domain-containing protein n=1 Tax=Pontibacter burrus TaxID=2704466 RepID=A0A6B3M1H5_9BACT|nr:alcohol dehydrogenase catalytic domain-containing protein [Pontibacter burrus]